MSRKDKLLEKLKNKKISPREFYALLKLLGYKENNKGKTSGSSIIFEHEYLPNIMLHKAHNGRDFVHKYECINLLNILKSEGIIWEK